MIGSLKENMLKILEERGVSEYRFYKETGISRGTLSNTSGLNEETIKKFLEFFPDIEPNLLFQYSPSKTVIGKSLKTVKERINEYITLKKLKKKTFFESVGVTQANFRGPNINTSLSSAVIQNIKTKYPNINLNWVLMGEGPMEIVINSNENSGSTILNDLLIKNFEINSLILTELKNLHPIQNH